MQPVIRHNLQVPEGRLSLRNKILTLLVIAGTFIGFGFPLPRLLAYSVIREAIRTAAVLETWNWPQVVGEHFIVRYSPAAGEEEMARMVLENAEEIYEPVVKAYGYKSGKKILVVVYPTREALGRTFGWDADESAMGVYWGGVIRVLSPEQWIADQDKNQIKSVFAESGPMAHEFTHLVVDYRTRGNYTRWLTEGIAQYKEWEVTGFQFDEPGANLDQPLYPLDQMDEEFDNLPNQALAYRQSLLAINYLVEKYGENKINVLMDELGKGLTMDQAFTKVFGVNLITFEQQWQQWIKANWQMPKKSEWAISKQPV